MNRWSRMISPDLHEEIIRLTQLSSEVNGPKHTDKLLLMMTHHIQEITELHDVDDPHWQVEAADLILLTMELLMDGGADIDSTITYALPRFYVKIEERRKEQTMEEAA